MASSPPRRFAAVTGASSGIGLELARQFATHGFDLLVAAEDDGIAVAAAQLAAATGARVEPVQVDLTQAAAVEELHVRIRGFGQPLDAIALNAGLALGGAFATDTALEDELAIIDLNVRSTVHLAKRVVGDMVARGEGRILITSSIVAAMPGPFQAIYTASKSFVQSFGLALRSELADTGVTVTVLMPGPTDTPLFGRAGMLDTRIGASRLKDDPVDVARDAFEALMAGKERVVSASLLTKLQARGSRLLPDGVKAALHKHMAKPGSAKR